MTLFSELVAITKFEPSNLAYHEFRRFTDGVIGAWHENMWYMIDGAVDGLEQYIKENNG